MICALGHSFSGSTQSCPLDSILLKYTAVYRSVMRHGQSGDEVRVLWTRQSRACRVWKAPPLSSRYPDGHGRQFFIAARAEDLLETYTIMHTTFDRAASRAMRSADTLFHTPFLFTTIVSQYAYALTRELSSRPKYLASSLRSDLGARQ